MLTHEAVVRPADVERRQSPTSPNRPESPIHQAVQPPSYPRLLPAVEPESSSSGSQPRRSQKDNGYLSLLISPFTGCTNRISETSEPRFARPDSGQVNGYVKFNWPARRSSVRSSVPEPSSDAAIEEVVPEPVQDVTPLRGTSVVTFIGPSPAPSVISGGNLSPVNQEFVWSVAASPSTAWSTPSSLPETSVQLVSTSDPRLLPPQFGFQAKMDRMDRQLFEFCTFATASSWLICGV